MLGPSCKIIQTPTAAYYRNLHNSTNKFAKNVPLSIPGRSLSQHVRLWDPLQRSGGDQEAKAFEPTAAAETTAAEVVVQRQLVGRDDRKRDAGSGRAEVAAREGRHLGPLLSGGAERLPEVVLVSGQPSDLYHRRGDKS